MFILCPLNRDVCGLNTCGIQLRLSLRNVRFGCCATLKAVLRQIQCLTVSIYGVTEEPLLRVRAPDLEIVNRDFSVETQTCGFKIRRARLRFFSRSRHSAAHASPKIDLIGKIKRKREISSAIVGLAGWEIRLIG